MPKPAPIDTSSFTKKERIAFAREMAAMKREEARARRRRNRALLIVGLILFVLVMGGLAGWALWARHEETLAGPKDMLSDGIVFTGDGSTVSAVTTARIEPGGSPIATNPDTYSSYPYMAFYLDFGNADSQTFWATNEEQLTSWLTSGYIALEVHPVAASGQFSKLAANAAACVADGAPDSFLTVATALFDAGSSDDSSARTASGVLGAVSNAGITDQDVLDCVSGDRFASWVTASTARAKASIPNGGDVKNAKSLPVLLVDGSAYTGAKDDADAFTEFISELYASEQSTTDGSTDGSSGDDSSDAG